MSNSNCYCGADSGDCPVHQNDPIRERCEQEAEGIVEYHIGDCSCEEGRACKSCEMKRDITEALMKKEKEIEELRSVAKSAASISERQMYEIADLQEKLKQVEGERDMARDSICSCNKGKISELAFENSELTSQVKTLTQENESFRKKFEEQGITNSKLGMINADLDERNESLTQKLEEAEKELEFLRDKYKVDSYESAIKVLSAELETEKEKYQEMVRTNERHVQKLDKAREIIDAAFPLVEQAELLTESLTANLACKEWKQKAKNCLTEIGE